MCWNREKTIGKPRSIVLLAWFGKTWLGLAWPSVAPFWKVFCPWCAHLTFHGRQWMSWSCPLSPNWMVRCRIWALTSKDQDLFVGFGFVFYYGFVVKDKNTTIYQLCLAKFGPCRICQHLMWARNPKSSSISYTNVVLPNFVLLHDLVQFGFVQHGVKQRGQQFANNAVWFGSAAECLSLIEWVWAATQRHHISSFSAYGLGLCSDLPCCGNTFAELLQSQQQVLEEGWWIAWLGLSDGVARLGSVCGTAQNVWPGFVLFVILVSIEGYCSMHRRRSNTFNCGSDHTHSTTNHQLTKMWTPSRPTHPLHPRWTHAAPSPPLSSPLLLESYGAAGEPMIVVGWRSVPLAVHPTHTQSRQHHHLHHRRCVTSRVAHNSREEWQDAEACSSTCGLEWVSLCGASQEQVLFQCSGLVRFRAFVHTSVS